MVQNSEEIWNEILNNQSRELIGTNEPNNGNGYHDGISWRIPFRPHMNFDDDFHGSTFYSIYLRDLGLHVDPSLSKKEKFETGFSIENSSKNYLNTFIKYFTANNYHYRSGNILRKLGEWGKSLCYDGRLIFEIIGWYDNNSNQFYAFQLNHLNNNFCKVNNNTIVYNAPYKLEGNKELYKKVKIPKSKCVIIEFPCELGGYKGYSRKVKAIKKLGSKFSYSENPGSNLNHMKNWDKQFNRIVSDWGASNKIEDVTEFYQELSALRFSYTGICCMHEVINGLNQLIEYLNSKLKENARVDFNIPIYDKENFKENQNKWLNGELSFKEANELIRI
ncbi:MAG: hypothetical protein A2266_04030 [Bacteroidetes bacterium RIFOXYA12_FULL_40_10]|nr:MAG: hypothetical protein A2266_04030 [Bacteroidetes bacterium RIFOXYA12_FULL_40_10]